MNVLKIAPRAALVLTIVSLVASGVATAADQPARTAAAIDIRPRMALAGVGGRILVRVQPDAENRRLRIVIESRSITGVSEVALDGLNSNEAYWFNLPSLPSGSYLVKAIVYGPNGPLSHAAMQLGRQ